MTLSTVTLIHLSGSDLQAGLLAFSQLSPSLIDLYPVLYCANLAPPTSTKPPVQGRIVGRRRVVASVAWDRYDDTTMTSAWVASCHNPLPAGRMLMDVSTTCWTEPPFGCREGAYSIQLKKFCWVWKINPELDLTHLPSSSMPPLEAEGLFPVNTVRHPLFIPYLRSNKSETTCYSQRIWQNTAIRESNEQGRRFTSLHLCRSLWI